MIPIQQETLVLAITVENAVSRLKRVIESRNISINEEHDYLFNGWIENGEFSISRKIKAPQNFLPLVKGSIEETSSGAIIFVQYKLFQSTRFFLIFWSFITALIFLFFLIVINQYVYALLSLSLGLFNYVIAWLSFRQQIKKTRTLIHQVLLEN
ncbi:hypothetical protein QQ008_21435 [Fulvivirgaceae bacterium BMA10]|uniref:Uncharacterized protein n=1 Tax=Splendidivirga corallicola TaxID=3051826 RepID=A0ABT8KUB8_9BACT|nr:hypothetical protein [Fulvivirgaceae bacterium BMA10]